MSFAARSATAGSITDTFQFSNTFGSITPQGQFTYDTDNQVFTNFEIDWDGSVFNSGYQDGNSDAYIYNALTTDTSGDTWNAVENGDSNEGGFFIQSDTYGALTSEVILVTYSGQLQIDDSGVFTLTTEGVTTPEPGTVILMLGAMMVAILGRTCSARGRNPVNRG
jgi:hypothetical protein